MAGLSVKPPKGASFPGLVWAMTRLGLHTDASVLSTTTINGPSGTWAKTNTGEYTYTLATGWTVNGAGFRKSDLTSPGGQVFLQVIAAADGTVAAEVKSMDLTTGTVVIRTFTKSTGASVNTGAAMQIDMLIALLDSSVT